MKSNKRLLILAIVFGLLTVLALNFYLQSLDTPALPEIPYSNVVVAQTTIPAHTRIVGEMLEVVSLPSEAVHPEAATNINMVVNGISRAEIIMGEQVLMNRVFTEERRATISYRIPEGKRAIAIPVSAVTGVAGYISPGDKVDILISFADATINTMLTTYTIFQNIEVLAAGPGTRERDTEDQEVVPTLTLAVTPEQAEVLAYANLTGSFHITLRSIMDDTIIEEMEPYSFENFETYKERGGLIGTD